MFHCDVLASIHSFIKISWQKWASLIGCKKEEICHMSNWNNSYLNVCSVKVQSHSETLGVFMWCHVDTCGTLMIKKINTKQDFIRGLNLCFSPPHLYSKQNVYPFIRLLQNFLITVTLPLNKHVCYVKYTLRHCQGVSNLKNGTCCDTCPVQDKD